MPDQFNAFDRIRPKVNNRNTSLVSMAVAPSSAPVASPPPVDAPSPEPKSTRTTMRIESELMGHLAQWRVQKNINADTFLEAAIALAKEDPELLNKLLVEAGRRTEQRKVAKEEKKIDTLIRKRRGQ